MLLPELTAELQNLNEKFADLESDSFILRDQVKGYEDQVKDLKNELEETKAKLEDLEKSKRSFHWFHAFIHSHHL